MPATLAPYPPETLLDVVRRQARERPDAAALRFEGAVTTYRELLRQAEAFGRALAARGIRPGDRVALVLRTARSSSSLSSGPGWWVGSSPP